MTTSAEQGLLPAGLEDELPPRAEFEAAVIERLLAAFRSHGYQRVKPPLIEFEGTMLAGPGQALADQTFRLMDPQSHRMMGVRPDMTVQVARIAATRLAAEPRPVRLSYGGQVLRVRGTQLRPERQFAQAGLELIGAPGVAADVEVLVVAAEALAAVGTPNLSVDVGVPTLVPALCEHYRLSDESATRVRGGLDRKDVAALADLPASARTLFSALLACAGPADAALQALGRLDLPPVVKPQLDEVHTFAAAVRQALPDLMLTLDAGEFRGFEYHTGISFTAFARGVRGELGRGGRYRLGSGETATGFTVYLDSLKRAVAAPAAAPRLYVPFGTPWAEAARLRREGWQTVAGLEPARDPKGEARRLGCTHIVDRGAAQALA
jgi:ATP phosphoribosyltransferase regulatory subunit